MTSEDLHARRVSAVRAWTRSVSEGVRPEILRSWQLSGVVSPTVTEAPLAAAVVEACLAALPVHHPVAPLLKGKLAAPGG